MSELLCTGMTEIEHKVSIYLEYDQYDNDREYYRIISRGAGLDEKFYRKEDLLRFFEKENIRLFALSNQAVLNRAELRLKTLKEFDENSDC